VAREGSVPHDHATVQNGVPFCDSDAAGRTTYGNAVHGCHVGHVYRCANPDVRVVLGYEKNAYGKNGKT
jgi:hypothetical protein